MLFSFYAINRVLVKVDVRNTAISQRHRVAKSGIRFDLLGMIRDTLKYVRL